MRLKTCATVLALLFVIQCEFAACYRSEVEITPAPPEDDGSKKSGGFFSGFKNFFRGSTTTPEPPRSDVVTPKYNLPPSQPAVSSGSAPNTPISGGAAQKPPPLNIQHAPLQPLGPRPDTPPSSPLAGNQQQPPQWPQAGGTTARTPQPYAPSVTQTSNTPIFGAGGQRPNAGAQPAYMPGFGSYQPPRSQPSGLDLSYGGAGVGGGARPGAAGRPGFGLAPLTSSTTTTTTTPSPKPASPQAPQFDLRGSFGTSTTTTPRSPLQKEDFPALPAPRRPSTGTKEDFPALPPPRSPSPTPGSPVRPSSPSAWNSPLSTPATPTVHSVAPTPVSPVRPGVSVPSSPTTNTGGNGVSFVPHSPGTAGSTTTVRPGFESSSSAGNSLASDDEIRSLTEQLFQKENSQLSLIRVNPQGKTRSIDSTDEAPQPLLDVDPKALEASTIAKMRLLFNNYESDTSTNEYVTPNERKEENDFVDAVMATTVMRQAMQFLQTKDIVSPDPKTHRDLVKELWFTQYSRGGGRIGSSGFEHVFVNEVKNGTIIGLHNWVYFYEEELAGRLDYKGYMQSLDMGTKGKVMKVRFSHNGLNKPVNSLFIGTSPELELALYTVCFKLRPDRTCPVSLGNQRFGIVTYSWRYRGKNLIGSAYPDL